MSERRLVTISEPIEWDVEVGFPIRDFIGALNEAVAKLPEALQKDACFAVDSEIDYGYEAGDCSCSVSARVFATRRESDEEFAGRLRQIQADAARLHAREEREALRLYARLKSRFGE